jgi:hypothetical protein
MKTLTEQNNETFSILLKNNLITEKETKRIKLLAWVGTLVVLSIPPVIIILTILLILNL